MSITNVARPGAASFTNTTRVAFAELWSTISTTWASETRTWAATVSLMTDVAKSTTSMTNVAKPT